MLAILGLFPLHLKTTPYSKMERKTSQRLSIRNRIGKRPIIQNLSEDTDEITLSGVLAPGISGGKVSLDYLRLMKSEGKPLPFIDSTGDIFGLWVIQEVSEIRTEIMPDGEPKRIEYTIKLLRFDDSQIDVLRTATNIAKGII